MREEADVLLFPSLHDEASWVVVEALSQGLPVLCLDHGGPPVVARAVGGQVEAVSLHERDIPEALARALELTAREPPAALEASREVSLIAVLAATAKAASDP
jgi:glycosyltransferase involved in cell wall biosynthesis